MAIYNFPRKITVSPEIAFLQTALYELNLRLKKQLRTFHKNKFNNIPWYFLLGNKQSGKSSIVTNSGLDFIESGSCAINESLNVNWYLSENAMIIELPEIEQTSQTHTTYHLNAYKRYRLKRLFRGIILLYSFEDLALSTPNQITNLTQKHLHFARNCLQASVPIYLLFSKADLINGFNEFFSDLEPNEQIQPWGFNLEKSPHEERDAYLRSFSYQFNCLLDKLNARIVYRLQHERARQLRIAIHEFPMQLESFKENIAKVISASDIASHGIIKGIYFCSAKQRGIPFDRLKNPLAQVFELQETSKKDLPWLNKAFFVHEFFTKVLFTETTSVSDQSGQRAQSYSRFAVFGAASAVVCASVFVLVHDMRLNFDTITMLQKNLGQFSAFAQQGDTANARELLSSLNLLKQASESVSNAKQKFILPSLLRFNKINRIQAQTEKLYLQTLNKKLLPLMQTQMVESLNQIKNNQSHPSAALYQNLLVYLMFAKPSYMNINLIENWSLQRISDFQKLSQSQKQELTVHIGALLRQVRPLLSIPMDKTTIANSRLILASLPKDHLALLILKSHFPGAIPDPFALGDKNITLSYQGKTPYVPNIYDPKNFNKIYRESIVDVCREAIDGNWVLGADLPAAHSAIAVEDLVLQVRALYLIKYLTFWQKTLNKIDIAEPHDLMQAYEISNKLADPIHSPLKKINEQIESVVNVALETKALDDLPLNSKNTLLTPLLNFKSQKFVDIFQALTTLKNQLAQINHGSNTEKVAFMVAKQRFLGNNEPDPISDVRMLAQTIPNPARNWLTAFSERCWQLVMVQAKSHINHVWKQSLLQYYHQHIEDRYPFDHNAKREVAIAHFSKFFGPQGMLVEYYEQYLSPFLNTKTATWENKTFENQSLNIPHEVLEQFERAKIIQAMFFGKDRLDPNVEFTLQAVAFKNTVSSLSVLFNNSHVTDSQMQAEPHVFHWPDPQNAIMLTFEQTNGQKINIAENGAWALFKLLDNSHMTASDNPKLYSLIFSSDASAAKYQLVANRAVNPFIDGILNLYRAPENIV